MAVPGRACAWAARMASSRPPDTSTEAAAAAMDEQVEMVIVQPGEQCAPGTLDHHVRSATRSAIRSASARDRLREPPRVRRPR